MSRPPIGATKENISQGMNVKILHFFIVLVVSATAFADNTVQHVLKIESLSEISTIQPKQTLFLFDIDDTIFDSPYMLGSKAWRRYIVEATQKIDSTENWHDVFSYSLAQKHPLVPVEEMTSRFVKDLQDNGYVVCGFTARERNIWYDTPQDGVDVLTVEQLRSVDVDFNNQSLERVYTYLSTDPEYFYGVFFANIEPKGNYLLHLLQSTPRLPEKVIFIDDKPSQVESCAKALDSLGIPHECYMYSATDEKGKGFDPLIANIELYYFYESDGNKIISDRDAAFIAKENFGKDAEYYLRATLEIAKKKRFSRCTIEKDL